MSSPSQFNLAELTGTLPFFSQGQEYKQMPNGKGK